MEQMEQPGSKKYTLDGQSILLIEDNEDEILIMQRAFRKAKIKNPLYVVANGEEAVEYLDGRGQFFDRARFPLPIAIFLDLNLPRKSGFEVLKHIRHKEILLKLAVNVLTSSTRPADIDLAAELGANAYLVKPSRIENFQEMIETWYNLARYQAYANIG